MTCAWHGRGVDRHFEDRLTATGEVRMRARLARCARCRARYERHLVIEEALAGGGAPASARLWRSIQVVSGRGVSSRDAAATPVRAPLLGRSRQLALGGAALASIVALAVSFSRGPMPTRTAVTSEPTARGGETALAAPSLHVFRSVSAHAAEPVADGATIHARDGLLFAYSSFDPAFTYLMVFGVDAAYDVHWYYPAFLRQGDDPKAVPIVAGAAGIELGEEIRHDLPPGPLRIDALFLREPRGVLEIEAIVRAKLAEPRRSLAGDTSLAVPGAAETTIMLQVAP